MKIEFENSIRRLSYSEPSNGHQNYLYKSLNTYLQIFILYLGITHLVHTQNFPKNEHSLRTPRW